MPSSRKLPDWLGIVSIDDDAARGSESMPKREYLVGCSEICEFLVPLMIYPVSTASSQKGTGHTQMTSAVSGAEGGTQREDIIMEAA